MASSFTKKSRHIDKVLEDSRCATAHGGQLIVDALAREFGLWERVRRCGLLDPRKDKSRGFSPEMLVAQLVFSFCSGGVSLSDAGRLGEDKALGDLLGMDRWAEETTIGEWLRAQNAAGLRELWGIIREFVAWVLARANEGRVRRNGELEVFFDDTQIEVEGKYFEGVGVNYEGARAYSWQTLWVGPFVADAEWGPGNRDVSASLGTLLESTASLWEEEAREGRARFYADSGSSAGKYLNLLDGRGWNWTVSYNKWTDGLDRLAAEMGEGEWSEVQESTGRNGEAVIEQFGWVRHLPGEACERAQTFAVVRWKNRDGGDLFWRYAYVVGGGSVQENRVHEPVAAREVFIAHRRKGAKEQGFHQLLGDMDLHHPPCLSSSANEFYYAIGVLAFDLLMAVKVLYLADAQQGWTVRSIIRFWLTVPVKLSSHAHRRKARIFVPKASMRWWRLFLQNHYPKRKPGRPAKENGPPAVELSQG